MKQLLVCLIAIGGANSCLGAEVLYANDFQQAEVGKVPEDFMVLDGGFVVKQQGTNKFLELPGAPLDTFSLQFGPSEGAGVSVYARINSTAKGRRFSTFGVGLGGVAGYKLQVAPGKKDIEILKDQTVVASVPYEWSSGEWVHLRLQVRKDGEKWRVEGKAWRAGISEPAGWSVKAEDKEEPLSGRASVFGSPFSGTPIQYDDLKVEKAKGQD